jgi:hypothetical protein
MEAKTAVDDDAAIARANTVLQLSATMVRELCESAGEPDEKTFIEAAENVKKVGGLIPIINNLESLGMDDAVLRHVLAGLKSHLESLQKYVKEVSSVCVTEFSEWLDQQWNDASNLDLGGSDFDPTARKVHLYCLLSAFRC